MGAWDNLSIREKADIMKAAIRNGITTLPEIKQAYNEFAEGGNIYGNGGSKKSGGSFYQTHKARWNNYLLRHGVPAEQAARLSGFFSAQDALESGHGTSSAARQKNNFGGMQRLDKKTNKMVNISYPSVDAYMDAKWKMMQSRFGRALNANSIQEYSNLLNDPRYHGKGYMYALYEGYRDGKPLDVAKQTKHMNDYTKILMDIAGEKGFKGAPIPAGSQSNEVEAPASIARPENPYLQFVPFTPFNPQAFGAPQAFVAPTREEFEVEQPIVEAANDYAYSPEQLEKEERRQGLNNLSFILGMMNGGNGSSFADTIGMLTGNIAAKGGPIHIKPENRGKFTALKKRTGHSATWFKEHGTPAQKKMATFALNSRHWKHGYGGHIYDGTTEDTQQMNIPFEIVGKGQLNPELNYGNITVGGRKGTLLSANYDTNLGRIKYDDGTEEDVQLARNFWINSKNNNSNSSGSKTLTEIIPQYNWDRDSYLAQQSRIDEEVGNRLPNIDRTITGLSNLWNYSKGYLKNKLNGDDSGILLNLADKNVSRIMSHTGDVETILANDFVENNNNMVRKKKDFINTTDTLLGDKKIPLSKISTFYGIEDGKLKAGPLDIFDDNTVVVPNRAKYVGRIKEYHPMEPSSKEFKEAIQKGIAEYNKSKGYEPDWLGKILPFSAGATPGGVLYNNLLKEEGRTREGRKRAQERRANIIASIEDKYSYLGEGELPYVITENNDTIRGYELNASPKTLFADENGNAVFVSSPRKHAKELNLYLKEHPMYPIMVDNGRYASYQTDFPNAEVYGGLNRPNNMFILGTTKKKALGGNLYDGITEDTQQMNIPYAGELPDVTVMPRRIANKAWDKVQERWVGDMPTYYAVNPETGKEEMLREIGNGKYSTYDDKHVFDALGAEAAKKQREQWIKNGGNASDFDKVMLGTLGLGLAPIALPEAATGIWAASQTPVGQTLLAGTLGGEAWEALNHGITGQSWGDNLGDVIGLDKDNYLGRTALGLTNPFYFTSPSMIYKGGEAVLGAGKEVGKAINKGLDIFNSPLTGKWTTVGNREYRLSPNSLGANGALLESREPSPWIKEIPLDEARYYRQVNPDALDSYKATGVVSQFNEYGINPTRYEVPMFTKGKPSLYREEAKKYGDVWVVSKPESNLEWESVKGAAVSPKYNGEFNSAPISEFEFYQYDPAKGYVKLDEELNLPNGINFSRTPHIDYLKGLSEQQQIEYLTQNGLSNQWLWTLKNNPDHLEGALSKAPIPNISTPQITAENAASITPEQWTAAQDAAIARGDMAEAQRLRDLHFKVNAPNTQIVDKNGNPIHSYHGTGKHFNEFDTTGKYSTLDEGYYGKGAYFAPNKELAQMYADTERTPIMYDTYLNIKNPLRHVRDESADLYGKAIVGNDGVISILPDDLVDETFDMTEYVATKPNQIKLANAVTYDDKGVRIPLGERDNFNINDMRYGLLPFGIGLTGYGLYNSGKEK